MILRLGLLALLLLSVVTLWLAVVLSARFRVWRRVDRMRQPELSQGKATLLYFTGEYCTVCHYRQSPAIDQLRADHNGTVRVLELDAAAEGALARRFGVLSLPTTVVLAPDGTVTAVNYGFASREQLHAQLLSLTA